MSRKFLICLNPEVEDVEIVADKVSWDLASGWLHFYVNDLKGAVAVFPPGWRYLQEVFE